MPRTFLLRRLLPSALLFLALPVGAVGIDFLLHAAGAGWIGEWAGPLGSALLVVSFAYSLRKRRLIRAGNPAALLRVHEVLSWTAALLLVVHGGVHFNAWIPWLGILALLVVTASGLAGRHLLADARRALAAAQAELRAQSFTESEIGERLISLALLTGAMQRWRRVHMPVTAVFAGLALVHVVATILLW
ncbi:MAG: hypothetical protein IPJ19_14950 [Planctomycetes bacterium]|nr:hypothetical protein [Planctomycetota bacterium]